MKERESEREAERQGERERQVSLCLATKVAGYYEQWGERHPMEFASLSLADGAVSGCGLDGVGLFELRGSYHGASIRFCKTYVGQHSIMYKGAILGEGDALAVEGAWYYSHEGDGGSFRLDLAGSAAEARGVPWAERHALLESAEARARGARVVSPARAEGAEVRLAIELPLGRAELDEAAVAAAAAAAAGAAEARVESVAERTWVYCEHADAGGLRQWLEDRRASLPRAEWLAVVGGLAGGAAAEVDPAAQAAAAVACFERETSEWAAVGRLRRQGRARQGGLRTLLAEPKVASLAGAAGLVLEEAAGLRLYTGPMYLVYNAVLRGFPRGLLQGLRGNQFETTLFLVVSGVVKLARVTHVPPARVVYRGLGGMLLPDCFWRAGAGGFRGGVEYGLMSTTPRRDMAVQYSGLDKRRATVFEIQVRGLAG